MTQIIAIVSGKGGVGKSTTAINLGTALSKLGKEAVVVDANLTTPDIGLYLGTPSLPITLSDVLNGKKHVSEAIYLHPSGLKLIPADIALEKLKKLNSERINKALFDLIGSDVVIVDSAASLSNDVINIMKAADEVFVVTNPELPAVTDALKTSKLAEGLGKKTSIVLNRMHKNSDLSIKEVESMFGQQIRIMIPEDDKVSKSLKKREPVVHAYPRAKSSKQFKELAKSLIEKKEKTSFWQRIFSFRKKN